MSATEISTIITATTQAPDPTQNNTRAQKNSIEHVQKPDELWLQRGMPDEATRVQLRHQLRHDGPDLFQSMDFLAGPACDPDASTLITAFDKDGLVGLCGFDEIHKGPLTWLSWAGTPLPQSNRLRIDPNKFTDFLPRFSNLARSMRVDGLFLNGLIADDMPSQALIKAGAKVIKRHQAPVIELADYEGLEAFEMSWTGPTRKSRRRRRKALLAAGDVRFEIVQEDEMLINQVIEMKKTALAERGLSSQLFRSDEALMRLKSWLNAPGETTKTMISALYLDNRLIAGEIGLVYGERYTAYLGAMDMAHTTLSPGAYQLEHTIDWACKNGIKLIDLLPPSDNYKRSMANNFYDVVDVFWPISLKGLLVLSPWFKTIRPGIKKLYGKLPISVQQILADKQIKSTD